MPACSQFQIQSILNKLYFCYIFLLELSEVLWNMVLSKGLQSDNWTGAIVLSLIFAAWAGTCALIKICKFNYWKRQNCANFPIVFNRTILLYSIYIIDSCHDGGIICFLAHLAFALVLFLNIFLFCSFCNACASFHHIKNEICFIFTGSSLWANSIKVLDIHSIHSASQLIWKVKKMSNKHSIYRWNIRRLF